MIGTGGKKNGKPTLPLHPQESPKTMTHSYRPTVVIDMRHTHVYIPRGYGTGLPQNSLAPAEQVETIDKKYLLERRGAVSDDVVMTKLTKALQIQIGAMERYN